MNRNTMNLYNLISLAGLFLLMLLAWVFSTDRRRINPRVLIGGVAIQLLFGAFVFLVPAGSAFFLAMSRVVVRVLGTALEGARFCFGPLAIPPGETGSIGFILTFQGLATIQAGPAAVAFGAVVVLTMFAAMSFDPRLIWDPAADSAPSLPDPDSDHA